MVYVDMPVKTKTLKEKIAYVRGLLPPESSDDAQEVATAVANQFFSHLRSEDGNFPAESAVRLYSVREVATAMRRKAPQKNIAVPYYNQK